MAGPFRVSLSGHTTVLCFRDQHTNRMTVYGITRKSEYFSRLKLFCEDNPNLDFLFSDNAPEFLTPEVQTYLKTRCKNRVVHRRRPPGQTQSRYAGKIEGSFALIWPQIRVSLFAANLPPAFWLLAAQHAAGATASQLCIMVESPGASRLPEALLLCLTF